MPEASSRLSTALADRYRLERELGQGGMATVYLAQDLKHRRKVALKVLRPELSAVLGSERFLNEITITANLAHPHILQLYDSGEAGGQLFYVMPFIEGPSLRDRLRQERRLALAEAVRITQVVAGALDVAHARGVIHRDIKPENILLQDGVPLLADFGIALAVRAAGGERLTETGLSLGTPAYMSPEQIVGERDLDATSDVYSLACVTYEMLAGDPPFVATNAQAVLAKHIADPAPPITTMRPDAGPALAHALANALCKVPADRPRSAGAFAAALTAADVAHESSMKSLLVLPFVNQSPDPDNEFFADGLTEEIIGDLSRLRGLRVTSRNSAMTLKGTKKDTPTLARELRVSHVVTGSVRRAGQALRVTAELVLARTDTPIWSDKYSGTLEDVFGIQEEIARKIVAALEMTLTETESRQVVERPIENPAAYDCYLRARQEIYSWLPGSGRRALQLVDDALRIVGDTPLLLAMKAQLYWNEVNAGLVPAAAGLPQAAETAGRALALDPDHALAIFVRGLVAGLRGRPEEALPDLFRAHELWPGDANILAELCRFANSAGVPHGDLVDRFLLVDPLMPLAHLVASFYYWTWGRFSEAIAPARRACELAAPDSMVPFAASMALAAAGEGEEAAARLAGPAAAGTGTALGDAAALLQCALRGDRNGALGIATSRIEQSMGEFTALFVAEAFMLIGQPEDALRWVRRAIDHGFINYPFLAQHDPFLAALRDDAQFVRMMDEVRPRWEKLVAWGASRR